MSILKSPAAFRRTATGLALILAPLLFIVSVAIAPAWADGTTAYLGEVADSPGAQAAYGLLQILAFPLLLVGILGAVHLIRGRGVVLAHVGAALAVIGLGTFPALAMTGVLDAVAVDTIATGQYATLIEDGFEASAATAILLLITLLPATLAAVVIGAAVWRSGIAPWWAGAAIIAGIVLIASQGSQLVVLVGEVFHLIGFGYIGLRMLRMTDAEWEHPPTDWRDAERNATAESSAPEPAAT